MPNSQRASAPTEEEPINVKGRDLYEALPALKEMIEGTYGLRPDQGPVGSTLVEENVADIGDSKMQATGRELLAQLEQVMPEQEGGAIPFDGAKQNLTFPGALAEGVKIVTYAGGIAFVVSNILTKVKETVAQIKEMGTDVKGLKDDGKGFVKFVKQLFKREDPEDKRIEALTKQVEALDAAREKKEKIKELEAKIAAYQVGTPDPDGESPEDMAKRYATLLGVDKDGDGVELTELAALSPEVVAGLDKEILEGMYNLAGDTQLLMDPSSAPVAPTAEPAKATP